MILTAKAMDEVGAAIWKARRESIEWWVKVSGGFIGMVTGLVGALIGVFTVLKHK